MLQPDDQHCAHCFDAVISHLNTKENDKNIDLIVGPSCPMFVTWKQTKNDQLRGCIGTFTPIELWSGLRKYSIVSAFQDRRFAPLQEKELPHLSVTVSLLGAFEDCQAWDDWEVGNHGIELTYNSKYSATFLPEVAVEQQWTKEQTIQELLAKAGYMRKSYDAELLSLTRYQSRKHSMSHCTYKSTKQNSTPY